jgi:hypothetical protein
MSKRKILNATKTENKMSKDKNVEKQKVSKGDR